jgi:putative membrane protein
MKNLKDYLLIYLKGISMGAADIVPGVSGGSIALITGIYQELLDSIQAFDKKAILLLKDLEVYAFWKHINGNFLASLLFGILTSIFMLSKVITFLLDTYPIFVWSFFSGLICVSALVILRDINRWNIKTVLFFVLGVFIAFLITSLPPISTPNSSWFTFVAGAIAICAMILPGVSGSFLLLIMGQYERILNALSEKQIGTILLFASGCVVGLLSFSRLISWLLKKHYAATIALLSGFMLGSLNKIWPWKNILSYHINSKGVQKPFLTENIWPHHYEKVVGQPAYFLEAILFFAFGVILVLGIERLASYIRRS